MPLHRSFSRALMYRTAATAAMFAVAGPAWAGPPYLTDDPVPADAGQWEIYAFGTAAHDRDGWEGESGLDINYGVAPNLQFTASFPFASGEGGRPRIGLGDVEVGAKYQFVHSESAGVSISLFPTVIFPTGSGSEDGRRVRLFLPVWAQKDFGPWSLFGGGGYTIDPGRGRFNIWEAGIALTRTVTPRLTIGGEIFQQAREKQGAGATTALGLGGTYRICGPVSLLVSAGPVFEHHRRGARFQAYSALGLSF